MKSNSPYLVWSAARVVLIACFTLLLSAVTPAKGKTVYVHLLDGDDKSTDGSYARPFKSWRVALQHVGSGDTIIAKNGDYRKAGRNARWGGLALILTMADPLEPGDPRQTVPPGTPAEAVGIYRYDPANPLTIRAETKQQVILDDVRFHLARGIVIEGFEIFPNPYYTDEAGKKLNRRRNGIHGDSVYEPEDSYNHVKTNDPPGGHTAPGMIARSGPATSRSVIRNPLPVSPGRLHPGIRSPARRRSALSNQIQPGTPHYRGRLRTLRRQKFSTQAGHRPTLQRRRGGPSQPDPQLPSRVSK